MEIQAWPFDQPPNSMAISVRSIIFEGAPILWVTHDEDDHGWQFLDGGDVDPERATVVSMATVVRHDPSVLEVADLPPGWVAWRESESAKWMRAPRSPA